jgi:hypothetical protein
MPLNIQEISIICCLIFFLFYTGSDIKVVLFCTSTLVHTCIVILLYFTWSSHAATRWTVAQVEVWVIENAWDETKRNGSWKRCRSKWKSEWLVQTTEATNVTRCLNPPKGLLEAKVRVKLLMSLINKAKKRERWGSADIAPRILNLGTRRRLTVSLTR